jgi:hypothetical protein
LLGLGRIGAFHAETLAGLPAVEELVISDPSLGFGCRLCLYDRGSVLQRPRQDGLRIGVVEVIVDRSRRRERAWSAT